MTGDLSTERLERSSGVPEPQRRPGWQERSSPQRRRPTPKPPKPGETAPETDEPAHQIDRLA
jgi:hypothetical protein